VKIGDVEKLGMKPGDDPKKALGKASMFSNVSISIKPVWLKSLYIFSPFSPPVFMM